jgi:hypothetical protein
VLNKSKLISELERYVDFVHKTRLTIKDGISACGFKKEEFEKFPPGTPGIHPYWDAEMWQLQDANELLNWFKYGKNKSDKYIHIYQGLHLKFRIAYLNYLMLNPQYKTLLICECGRGMEILLALCARDNWKKIYCYDIVPAFEKIIKDFFKDERIVFYNKHSRDVETGTTFQLDVLKEDDVIAVWTSTNLCELAEEIFLNPKIKMFIYNGVEVDKKNCKSMEDHKHTIKNLDKVVEDLTTRIEKKEIQ